MLAEPSNKTIQGVRETIGVNGKRVQEAVQMLRQWLELQRHLPQEIENGRLEQMFLRCKASLERTKKVLDMYYSLRNIIPEVLCDRDPEAPWFARAVKQQIIVPLPKLTEDYSRVTLIRLENPDPETYSALDFVKLLFMIEDVRLYEDYFASDTIVIDLKGTTLTVAAKWTLPILKKFRMCCEEGYSTRIHVHFGADCQKKLLSYRNWFLEQEKVKTDESRRPTKKVSRCDLFGFEGSFRTLSLD
ncbi:hypothetical protein C0J52_01307 [Blattella germanica]|nr:hypothetical protein C0J52_01307 [Blattella germanica]